LGLKLAIDELVLWILGIIVSFILGFLTSWFFYRKQRKDTVANAKVLKELRQYVNAQIRIGDNKDGKIIENSDGTIAIEWKKELNQSAGVSDLPVKTVVTKGKQSS
jgi:type II secretory pathway pseudopilin PulG